MRLEHGRDNVRMRVVVTGDTHIPDFAQALPPGLVRRLRRADLILHAGDVTASDVLDQLAQYAPVQVALGNNDRVSVRTWGATPTVRLELEGIQVGMVHDAGPRAGRERRLRSLFPDASMIVFGHSHIPMDYEYEGTRILNPGSPTWKRRQPRPTFGVIDAGGGRLRTRLVEL
jgi:putative phosphoesterase